MKTTSHHVSSLLLLAAMTLIPHPASAGTSFDFLFQASSVNDDNQFFLNLAVGNSGIPRAEIEPALPRLVAVENDLPVVLFLAQHSGRSVDFIVGLRAQNLSWSVIFSRVGVPYDVLFVGIEKDPGPPYGKAWGHWKKRSKKAVLTDENITGLVRVQTGCRLTGLSAFEMARAGDSVAGVVASKKGRSDRAKPAGVTKASHSPQIPDPSAGSAPGKAKPGKGNAGKGK